MALSRNKSPRRRELRRSITGSEGRWRSLLKKPVLWGVLWAYLFTLIAGLIALSGQNRTRYKVGQVVEETIVARVPFQAINEEKTLSNRSDARRNEPSVYNANTAVFDRIRESLLALGRLAMDEKIQTMDDIPLETQNSLQIRLFDRYVEVRKYITDKTLLAWPDRVDHFIGELAELPVVRSERAKQERMDDTGRTIRLRLPGVGNRELEAHDETIIDAESDRAVLESRVEGILTSMRARMPRAVIRAIVDIVIAEKQPLYVYDQAETERRRAAAAERVRPVEERRETDQVLVKAGTELGRFHVILLEQEQAQYDAQLGAMRRWLIRGGSFGLVLLIAAGLLVYVAAYNPRILHNPVRGAAIICLLLLAQGLAVGLTILAPQAIYLTATFPAILATMVLAIAYDRRFALAVGAMSALLILVSLKLTVGFSFILLTGVTLAASMLPDVRNRSTLVLAGFWTGIGMAIATWLVSLAGLSIQIDSPFRIILEDAVLVLLGAVVTGLFVQGMLPAIEKTFRVTTAMTLKDLNDASHPLLRRLAEEATGTYQHSLRIADMAEAAAETIGCNGLLCRVGAMYHDIGKVNKPEYFVENQHGGPNKHDKLRPAMSLLIIVGHVKDGVEMAREYKLPKSVIHFIESHHGTTLVEYFYHAARKQSEEQESASPTEFEFRYPGPKPQTKEAAILMLCDGVEGAARALPEPTPVRLEQLVNKMLLKRLMDGQFDECQITLQELHKVEQAVTRTLTAIYHGRIAYPKSEDEEVSGASPRELVAREPRATAS